MTTCVVHLVQHRKVCNNDGSVDSALQRVSSEEGGSLFFCFAVLDKRLPTEPHSHTYLFAVVVVILLMVLCLCF